MHCIATESKLCTLHTIMNSWMRTVHVCIFIKFSAVFVVIFRLQSFIFLFHWMKNVNSAFFHENSIQLKWTNVLVSYSWDLILWTDFSEIKCPLKMLWCSWAVGQNINSTLANANRFRLPKEFLKHFVTRIFETMRFWTLFNVKWDQISSTRVSNEKKR